VLPFLDENEVAVLNGKFDDMHPSASDQQGFVSGSYSNDLAYKKAASDAIITIFRKHFERLFAGYQTFGAAFLYKTATAGSELGVHQDWTIVDEEKYVALNCWVPLTDINDTNGALHVMPGSHYTKHHSLRAPTIPFFFTGSEKEVIARTIPFYVKAGQAVILNQSVIHYSPANKSGNIRKAITAGVKTKGAPMTFHYKTGDNTIEKFEMPEDFLISFENFATSIFEKPRMGILL
jgi:ectoine hydroxylase-related dioxygenase (phytanoyl-CoA dioxygenase family)